MSYPSDLTRTKNWGTETLTDSDLEGQLDLIINWAMAVVNSSTGHTHDGTSNQGPKIPITNLTVGSQALGDIIYSSSSTAMVRLAGNTTTTQKFLAQTGNGSVSAAPSWVDPSAVQATMETGTSTTTFVTPAVVKYSPLVAKAWVQFDGTGSDPITYAAGSGISGTTVAKNGAGDYTITWGTAFSSSAYCVVATQGGTGGDAPTSIIYVSSQTTTTCTIKIYRQGVGANDMTLINVVAFGDQ